MPTLEQIQTKMKKLQAKADALIAKRREQRSTKFEKFC